MSMLARLGLGVLSLGFIPLFAASAAPVPIAAFARQENMRSPVISPNGRYVAYITSVADRRVAVTLDLSAKTPAQPVLSTDEKNDFDLAWCHWANDTRLLCSYRAVSTTRLGIARHISRMVAVNADGSEQKLLMQNSSVATQDQDNVIDWTPEDPQTVLIQATEMELSMPGAKVLYPAGSKHTLYPGVFKLNVYDGRLEQVVKPYEPIIRFRTDGNGHVRLGAGLVGTTWRYYARLDGDREWRVLAKVPAFERTDQLVPVAVVPGKNTAYATGPSNGKIALYDIDLEDKRAPQLVFDHQLVDIGSALRDDHGQVVGVFYETDRPFISYMDTKLEALMEGMKQALPGSFNTVRSNSADRSKLVIGSQSDVDAGTYYIYDAKMQGIQRIGTTYPELDTKILARMRTIEYPASDGTHIPGYLTVPDGLRPEKLPLIVMPHEGPIARDSWRFNYLREFLASRGYAVLSMNFRGSAGYGGKWLKSAYEDWGGLTYSDITDGARWAVAQGIADPQHICIVGSNFGGYAALLGAERNGDLYKCSISIGGVSDLSGLVSNASYFRNGKVLRKEVGDDSSKLKEDSPVRHAMDVKIPVLLVHGELDVQSPVEQSRDMASALKKAGKQYKYVEIERGDHLLWRTSERTQLLEEVEKFLNENIGPGATPST